MGNLTEITYPDGKQVNYTYDKVNRLIHVNDWADRTTAYSYDANGRLTRTDRPDGSTETRSYDDNGRIIELKDEDRNNSIINLYTYAYDAAGGITNEYSQTPQQDFDLSDVTMTYSSDNRLAAVNGEPVVYDADGNMTVGPLQGTMQGYTYDSRNCLTAAGATIVNPELLIP